MDNNDWLLMIAGLCIMSVWPVNWYFRGRRRYKAFILKTRMWHKFYARSMDEAKIKAAKLAAKSGAHEYWVEVA
jgi:hypothetical protein